MSKRTIADVPVVRTPQDPIRVSDGEEYILMEVSPSGQLQAWRPARSTETSPTTTPEPSSGPPPKRCRRSLSVTVRKGDFDIERVFIPSKSGNKEFEDVSDENDEGEDSIMSDMVVRRQRLVARKLREYEILREERQPDALEEFLESEGLSSAEMLTETDGGIAVSGGGDDGRAVANYGAETVVSDDIAVPKDLTTFSWSEDFSTFSGQREVYLNTSGPQVQAHEPADLFMQVWDLPFVSYIVEKTNNYAWQTIAKLSEDGRIPKSLEAWEETTVDEIYRLFAILNYMSFCVRATIDEYWTTGPLGMADFRSIMSRNRFIHLMRFLTFVDNDTIEVRPYHRKISEIAPVLDHCNNKFSSMYTPQQTLSLDESLLLWKGRLSWVQCVRTKAARFGIKSFELCEAESGYTLRSLLDTGKDCVMSEGAIDGFENTTAKVVLEVMDGYLDVGHTLVMDNWYNQLSLTRYLKRRHTDVIGTSIRRRIHVPEAIKCANERSMRRGDQLARHCGDMSIVAWKDVKLVTAISTFHNAERVVSRRAGVEIYKPKVIDFYNRNMGGVNLKDQKLKKYHFERKSGMKWYMKVFQRLLNTSLLNTFIIYKKQPTERVLSHRQFRYKVSEGLLAKFAQPTPKCAPVVPVLARLNESLKHFPVYTDHVTGDAGKRSPRRCARCSAAGRYRRVNLVCRACNVALCAGSCWLDYHSLQEL